MFYAGIRVTESGLETVLLERRRDGLNISLMRSIDKDVKPLYIIEPMVRNRECTVVTGLSGRDVLMRNLSFSLNSKKALRDAIPFQAEGVLPYPVEDAVLSPHFFNMSDGTDAILFAAKKESLSTHLNELAQYDIEPDRVSCIPQALFRVARYLYPENPSVLVLQKEGDSLLLVCIREGKLHSSIWKTLPADPEKVESEINRLFASIRKSAPEIEQILLIGESTHHWVPPQFTILEIESPFYHRFAVPLGLALDAAKKDDRSVQLLQGYPAPRATSVRKTALWVGYFAASICFTLCTLFMGNALIKRRERAVLKELQIPQKSFSASLKQLNRDKRAARSLHLPQTPPVSKLLTWLSSHPAFKEGCTLSRLSYQEVKGKGFKVDLEFFIDSPASAEKVRRALVADRSVIDRSEGVHWNNEHSHYSASFHLRSNL